MPSLLRVRQWALTLIAVLGGNALYFWALAPALPARWTHAPFQLDPGLLLDFACCLGVYLALRAASRRHP